MSRERTTVSRLLTRPVGIGIGIVALAWSTSVVAGQAGDSAWADDLSPISVADWDHDTAAHLLERAGFGGTPSDVAKLAAMTPEAAIASLVDYHTVADTLSPFDASPIWDPAMDPFPKSRAEAVRIARETGMSMGVAMLPEGESRRLQPVVNTFFYGLRSNAIETQRLALWWGQRMLLSTRPLEEKLTLFWHGHFSTGNTKVRDTRMMLRQNEMLRTHAAGSFRDLLLGILKDPAMLVYLDNRENVKDHPNENFGRELLELFTMGVGNYSEEDIREASRAFTGWTNNVLEFHFEATQHDYGPKTFLGQTGLYDGTDIIELILDQEPTAEYIAGKLYRYFVRQDLSQTIQAELGATLRNANYELAPLLARIFMSRDFYSAPSVATQIKSPVHLIVSTYRKLGLQEMPTIPDFNRLTASLGQTMFNPPNVAGWAGGRSWITPGSLLQRGNLFRTVMFAETDSFYPPDRAVPGIYASVARRLEQGMNITAATQEGDAESSMLADRDEDYNTRYGGYMGYVMAFEKLKAVPRRTPNLDLVRMVNEAGANEVEAVVDHFIARFLRVALDPVDRDVLVDFLRDKLGADQLETSDAHSEAALRGLLYLVLSTPEYQLA
jgi:uncharacterized protein (DUF1800 family)